MINRITLEGVILAEPKIRSFEARGESHEVVSLWIETKSERRTDRFTVEIYCAKTCEAAKAMREGVLAEITGVLRHDRWKHKQSGAWTGKVYVAIDPGQGSVRSRGLAASSAQSEAA